MSTADIYINAFADEASSEIDGQICALKRNNLSGIEIRNVDGTNISDITCAKAKKVRAKFDNAGLSVFSVGSPIGKIDIDDAFEPHAEKLRRTLEIACILGAKYIRVFSFYIPSGKIADIYCGKVTDRLGAMCDIADEFEITLCHENEKGIYGDTAERCRKIFEDIPSLGGVFDPANFVQCGENALDAWNIVKPHINYLHIKDCAADGTIVPAGEGIGNIREIISDYTALGKKYITLEPHLMEFDGLSGLERNGEQSAVGGHVYSSNDEAFDAACAALNKILGEI